MPPRAHEDSSRLTRLVSLASVSSGDDLDGDDEMTEVKRATRVAVRVREELASILSRDARDPRIAGVVVARVEMSDDLRSARVYVRMLEGGEDETRRKDALAGLARASGMLRREIAQRMKLRVAPEIRFYYDAAQEKIDRIESLLEEVRREQRDKDRKA
jgi:ribosome-binding factor A